jgi:mannose-binding lectin 1
MVDLVSNIPDYGYFTIFAETDSDLSDNNDLYSVRTQPESEIQWGHISEKLLTENRKILESDAIKRREAKQARRSALLPTMHQYLDIMKARDNRLDISSSPNGLKDAFAIIEEAAKRGMEAVTIDMLKVFINRYLQETLGVVGSKVKLAMEQFDDSRSEINEMWSYLRQQLLDLAIDTRLALQTIAEESVAAAKEIQIPNVSPEVLGSGESPGLNGLGKVLLVVSILELIAYLVFFGWKHSRTQGFKKVD